MNLYTQSLENATVVLTNGGAGSDEALLSYRDLRVYGINVGSAATTVTIHIDFGSAKDIDYILLGSIETSDEIDWSWDYSTNDSDWDVADFDTGVTFNGDLFYLTITEESARYWRLVFTRTGASPTLKISCIFTGVHYTFPVNYQYNNNRITQQRTESQTDIYGYPYGQAINSSKKFIWEVSFNMTKAQVEALETQLEIVDYNLKPFFLYDSLVDSDYHLVRFPENLLNVQQQSYEYYNVPFTAIEL